MSNSFRTALLSMSHFFYKGGKCECFILVINDILEYNLPYVQSDFTCNPGPTIFISSRYY